MDFAIAAGKFGDVPKFNGLILIGVGVLCLVAFAVTAYPAMKSRRVRQGGGPMGRALVAGPGGLALIVLGVVVLVIGH